MRLRDYQENGIAEIRNSFNAGIRRVAYVAPCGAGKGTMVAYMARTAAARGNRTLFLIHRRELLEQIQETIGEPHKLINLASVQTIARRLDKIPAPDLIISDEFHHGLAATWRKIFDRFTDAYLVGLTATPARTNGQGLSEICDKLIIGPTVPELILRGFLAPFKYYAPPVNIDLTGVKTVMGDYDRTELAYRMDRPHITGSAIEHYRTLADGKQAIVYCASTQHSKNTAEIFSAAGYSAKHVDGETPAAERKQAIADFKAGRLRVLCNMDLFGEGLNLPGVDVVILLRPTQSTVLHVQQSMRSMRPDPGNPFKTAVIIDAVGNCFRHGLPTTEHEWTLEGTRRTRKQQEGKVSIKQCPVCFWVAEPGPVCPGCGFVYPVQQRELEQKEGQLAELTEIERKQKRMQVGMCRTIADLKAVAAERGYAPGWVWAMAKAKGIKR